MATMKFTRAEDKLIGESGQVGGGPVDPSPLTGIWLNTDKRTGGITKLVLTQNDGGLMVRAFGACDPAPCDWGKCGERLSAAGLVRRKAWRSPSLTSLASWKHFLPFTSKAAFWCWTASTLSMTIAGAQTIFRGSSFITNRSVQADQRDIMVDHEITPFHESK